MQYLQNYLTNLDGRSIIPLKPQMIDKIVKRDGSIVPFDIEKIVFAIFRAAIAVGGRDQGAARKTAEDVLSILAKREYAESYPTVEEVQDLVEKCLIENGHAKTAKAYILYRYEHELKRRGKASLTYSSENMPYRKLWETLSWAVDNSCVSTEQLSRLVALGKFQELVEASEAFYQNEIDEALGNMESRLDEMRVLIIAGPSSSGKTTTTAKIKERLASLGRRTVSLGIDNYFFNLEEHPRDTHGDYDFETPQAIELSLVNRHLAMLLSGKEVDVPCYNFKKGRRDGISEKLSLPENGIILIDSLHGLFPEMTSGIDESVKYKLYIETLSQLKDKNGNFIRWSDIRMLRRMVRDMQFRNYDPRHTVLHWHHVRRSELRYIVSRLQNAHTIINSSLAFELPVMKARLGPYITRFAAEFAGDPDKEDANERVARVQLLFDQIPEWQDEAVIPKTSLLREFIGGGVYT